MHLELYDPYTDPSVYFDNLLPEKECNQLYLYNPHTSICGEELLERVQKMLRDRKLIGRSISFGFGFIEVKLRWDERKCDIAALHTICGGFLVSYNVEPEATPKPCGHYTDEEWQALEDERKRKVRETNKGKEY
jgi:hypothetical protein